MFIYRYPGWAFFFLFVLFIKSKDCWFAERKQKGILKVKMISIISMRSRKEKKQSSSFAHLLVRPPGSESDLGFLEMQAGKNKNE